MTDRSFQSLNAQTREQLKALLSNRSTAELQRPVSHNWTVVETLVHLAFWDLRGLTLLDHFAQAGIHPSPMDIEIANETVRRLTTAIQPQAAVQLWLEAATALDQRIEALPDSMIADLRAAGNPFNLPRHEHRAEHIAEIAQALK